MEVYGVALDSEARQVVPSQRCRHPLPRQQLVVHRLPQVAESVLDLELLEPPATSHYSPGQHPRQRPLPPCIPLRRLYKPPNALWSLRNLLERLESSLHLLDPTRDQVRLRAQHDTPAPADVAQRGPKADAGKGLEAFPRIVEEVGVAELEDRGEELGWERGGPVATGGG